MLLQQTALWYPWLLSCLKVLAWVSLFSSPSYSFSILEAQCWRCSTMNRLIFSLKYFCLCPTFHWLKVSFPSRHRHQFALILFPPFCPHCESSFTFKTFAQFRYSIVCVGVPSLLWTSCSLPLTLSSIFLAVSSHSHSTLLSGWDNSRRDQPWAPVVKPLQFSCQFCAGTVPFGDGCA